MRIALSQLNYHIGNFESNFQKIAAHVERAEKEGASLIVFPELAISGYPARDFLEQEDFLNRCEEYLLKVAALSHPIGIVIGCPFRNNNLRGKRLFNSAFYLYNGRIMGHANKALLPTYDIFDEYRYFEPETLFHCIEHEGARIALTVCEDLWNLSQHLYVSQPMEALVKEQPQLMINIAASPYSYVQAETRENVLRDNALRYRLPLVYVNHVGAQTDIIFDGGSLYMDADGEIVQQLAFFSEDFRVMEINSSQTQSGPLPDLLQDQSVGRESDLEIKTAAQVGELLGKPAYTAGIHQACVLGIRDYFSKLGFKTAVLGLSGGIDSALVCALAAEALGPENVCAVMMPSKYSSDHSLSDARALIESLGTRSFTIPITEAAAAFENTLSGVFEGLDTDLTEENIQARSRAVLLMALSNKLKMVLLNTSNKSEAAVGYGTLYGDMAGALGVIGDLYKTQVYALARYINRDSEIIPLNSILKAPSAELRAGQKDSDSLPDYDLLDQILYLHIEKKMGREHIIRFGFEESLVRKVISLVNTAEFKRYQSAPILRVSPKSFGMGRRMPIVGKY